ncbi:MAG: hypothetical protein QM770_17560 [Tepidisphaeraceae bacterium]
MFFRSLFVVSCAVSCVSSVASAQSVGSQVVGYTNPAESTFNNSSVVLGMPERSHAGTDVTVFSPTFGADTIVRIQPGGSLALKLSAPVQVNASRTLGVISNIGLIDASEDGSGVVASSAPFTFSNAPVANVSVSSDGTTYFPVSGGLISFTMPATGFTNSPAWTNYSPTGGSTPADFFKPTPTSVQDGGVASFAGMTYAQTVAALQGSGGGTWLSLGSTGLSSVNYVKFDVPSDAPAGSRFILDAVVGVSAPEPASLGAMVIGLIALTRRVR